MARRGRPAKRQTTEPLNGQIALAPAEVERLDITALENEARLPGDSFRAMQEELAASGAGTLVGGRSRRKRLLMKPKPNDKS